LGFFIGVIASYHIMGCSQCTFTFIEELTDFKYKFNSLFSLQKLGVCFASQK
jgi:hypothetical protein